MPGKVAEYQRYDIQSLLSSLSVNFNWMADILSVEGSNLDWVFSTGKANC